MMRSLYTGVSGLTNHQTRMDVLSNNIANVNTIGFKSSRTIFSDALSQTMQGATAPRDALGGVNAKQIGLGVKTSAIDIMFTKTSFQTTNVNTDLAINNNGFFIVNNGNQQYYTRAGDFYFDAAGNFVTKEGLRVMGWMANPVTGAINNAVPIEPIFVSPTQTLEPRITTYLESIGNLMADAVLGEAQSSSNDIYDEEGRDYRALTMYSKVDDNTWLAYTSLAGAAAYDGGTAPDDLDGITNNAKLIYFDGFGKFVRAEDVQVVDPVSGDPTIAQADADGTFNAAGGLTAPLTGISPFSADLQLANNAQLATKQESVIVFQDTKGIMRVLGVTATCTKGATSSAANDAEWLLQITEDGNVVGSSSYSAAAIAADPAKAALPRVTLSDESVFDFATTGQAVDMGGAVTNFNTVPITGTNNDNAMIYMPAGESERIPTEVSLTYSRTNFSQYAGGFNLGQPVQDGYGAGDLIDKTINSAGIIVGTFSNGMLLNLGQVATCIFNNQQGLERMGSTLFAKTNNSGEAIIGEAGVGGRGTIQAGVLEMANVDLAEEFTNMIVTQRGYQSNSRTITTSDEMLQELLNLKR